VGDREEQRGIVLEYFGGITLNEHLRDPHGWKAFHEFLSSEYCGENTRFWLAVEKLRTSDATNTAEVESMVQAISELHFGDAAPYEVNLPINQMRQFKSLVDSQQFSVNMLNEAQDTICTMLVSSHWRRYPDTPFFNSWLDRKLTDTDFLRSLGGPSEKSSMASTGAELEADILVRIQSVIRVKTLEEFLNDPLGFTCFKDYLGTSKLSLEYTDLLLFWVDVEEYMANPSADLGKRIFSSYLKKNNEGKTPILLSGPIYDPIMEKIEAGVFDKTLYTAAHLHARSKLRKDAFGNDLFESAECKKFISALVQSELAYLEDQGAGFPKLTALFAQGKPKNNAISRSGFEKVVTAIIADQYGIQFKNKQAFTAYCSQYMTSSSISFDEFTQLFHKLISEPNLPFYNTKPL